MKTFAESKQEEKKKEAESKDVTLHMTRPFAMMLRSIVHDYRRYLNKEKPGSDEELVCIGVGREIDSTYGWGKPSEEPLDLPKP